MKTKRVKKMDLDFSVLGYGCWGAAGMPSWAEHTDENQIRAIHTAIDGGVNFFDVAPVYGLGHAEEVLGKAIKGKREDLIIASKCGLPWNNNNDVRNDVRKPSILKEIDESLLRLQVDYIDLYQVHWPTADGVDLEETMSALSELKASGKVKYIGLTNYALKDMIQANNYVDIASMQGLYNMIEQNAESYHNIPLDYKVGSEILPFTEAEGMAFFPYSPLFQGLLSGAFTSEKKFELGDVRNSNPKLNGQGYKEQYKVIEELNRFSAQLGKPLNEIALNWLIAQKAVTSVIAGVRNAEQMHANLKALTWKLDAESITYINRIVNQKSK